MYLQDGTRAHFMKFIEREFPEMAPRMEKLYARKSPPESYRRKIKALVRVLQARYGAGPGTRGPDAHPSEEPSEPEQVGFAW
jgi:hypothetical protein